MFQNYTSSHGLPGLLYTGTFSLLFSAVNVLITLYCVSQRLVVHLGECTSHCIADHLYVCMFVFRKCLFFLVYMLHWIQLYSVYIITKHLQLNIFLTVSLYFCHLIVALVTHYHILYYTTFLPSNWSFLSANKAEERGLFALVHSGISSRKRSGLEGRCAVNLKSKYAQLDWQGTQLLQCLKEIFFKYDSKWGQAQHWQDCGIFLQGLAP